MYCIIKCIVQGKQARVKNADLRRPSCTVVMLKRKSASPVLSVLRHLHVKIRGPGSSVGLAIRYGLNGPGIESRWGRDFPHLSGRP